MFVILLAIRERKNTSITDVIVTMMASTALKGCAGKTTTVNVKLRK